MLKPGSKIIVIRGCNSLGIKPKEIANVLFIQSVGVIFTKETKITLDFSGKKISLYYYDLELLDQSSTYQLYNKANKHQAITVREKQEMEK
jgi:hypothetical protein